MSWGRLFFIVHNSGKPTRKMAEKDLRKAYLQMEETSFSDQPPSQEYHVIEKSEVETLTAGQHSPSSGVSEPSGHQRGLKPAAGLIMRIGRGVKSAVGGAVNILLAGNY